SLLLLTGLPMLCLLFFLGGVDGLVLLAGFAVACLTMFSLGGLSALHSVYSRRSWVAVLRTYLCIVIYLAVGGALGLLVSCYPTVASWPSSGGWTSPFTAKDGVAWFNAGNLPIAVVQIRRQVGLGQQLHALVSDYLLRYAIFHGAVGVGCCLWAAR